MAVNKVILIGNLGKDPELRTFPNGGQVANVTIATSERWRDKSTGESKEATEWHNVVFSDRLAEIAGQYLQKGSPIYIEGSLRTRKWQDKQTGQDRYATEVRVSNLQMLGSKASGSAYAPSDSGNPPNPPQPAATTDGGFSAPPPGPDDTPF